MTLQRNKTLNIGIQGGPGSFNEEAIEFYVQKEGIDSYKTHYLYTTQGVLEALKDGVIEENTAILGPRALSTMFELDIVQENLQDDKTNMTSFLFVAKR